MSRIDPTSDLAAALIWDKPRLMASASPGARAFLRALSLQPMSIGGADHDPLSAAAGAIVDELQGASQRALEGYRQLAQASDPGTRILGMCLLCWSDLEPSREYVWSAEAEIDMVESRDLRARLFTKLICAAFDHRFDDLLPGLFERAEASAPESTLLKRLIQQEAHNILGRPLPTGWDVSDDPLTEYPWVRDLAAAAAHRALRKSVQERAQRPWTLTFGFGIGPLEDAIAAEMQGRWAGAVWLRRDLQNQLAVQLLSGNASRPDDYASAVALWALGSGQHIPEVITLAEPQFDGASAERIVEHLTRDGDVALRFNTRLVEVAVECWDLLSEATALRLLDRFEVSPDEHPVAQKVATLWSLLSLRVPEGWLSRFLRLSDDQARSLLATTTPAVATRMPLLAASRLYELAGENSSDINTVVLRAALAHRLGRRDAFNAAQISAAAISWVATRTEYSVSEDILRVAVERLTDDAARVLSDAKEGRAGMGQIQPIAALASGIQELGEIPDRTRALLIEAATDASLPRDFRYDAVKALTACLVAEAVSPSDIGFLWREVPEAGAEPFWAAYSKSLMRAAKMQLAIASGYVDEHLSDVLVFSRHSEVRVRLDAIDACSLARRTRNESLLELVLLGALFDPAPEVARRALGGFAHQRPVLASTKAALATRAADLLAVGGRDVRAAIAGLVAKGGDWALPHENLSGLRELLEQDRSYEVREALSATGD